MYKKKHIFNLTFVISLFFCFSSHATNALDISDKIAYSISSKTATSLEKKYNMYCIGVKLGGPEKINLMGLHFQVFQKMSQEQCRKILIEGVQEYLANIKSREDFKQYLKDSFNENNLEIWLLIRAIDKSTLYYPDICFAGLINGKISYYTNDPENQFKYKTDEKETYEEALEKLNTF